VKVGIDLGTSYSLIARTNSAGNPTLLPDASDKGMFHTPSVAYISGRSAFVGQMAEDLLEQDPSKQIVRYFKRAFGTRTPVFTDVDGTVWLGETVGALVLKKVRFDAEGHTSEPLKAAVISVPAHFTDPQRKAVQAAAMMADIPLLGLVDEPVAAALHYGVSTTSRDQVIVVYDFGGGTFDTTVLSLDNKGVYVLAKGGLTELGGKEFDEEVARLVSEQFEQAFGRSVVMNHRVHSELRRVAESMKIEICDPLRKTVRRTVLLGGHALEVEVPREIFEQRIAPHVEKTTAVLCDTIREAGLAPKDVHSVLLVGGTSMAPLVRQRVGAILGKGPQVRFHDPSKAVAFGAALHASQLSGEGLAAGVPDEFRGVTGYHVGVRTINPETGQTSIDTLIRKNHPLPSRARKTYFTSRPGQERMVLELVQFRDASETPISLGQLVVGPLPSPRANYPISVTVEYREDGTVHVTAFDAQTGIELVNTFGREDDGGLRDLASQRQLVRCMLINNA
jgi:molecular chaperone DnaK